MHVVSELRESPELARSEGLLQNLRSKSVQAALFMAAAGGGESLMRLVSVTILARLLTPEHFGLVGMVTAITAIAGQLGQLGLSTATVQRLEINHKQVTNLFWINVLFGATLTAVFCASSPLISAFYGDERLLAITMVLSASFLCGGFVVQHEALLFRQMKQGQSAIVRLASNFLSMCLAVALAVNDWGYWALAGQEVARSFFTAIGVWCFCRWRPGLPYWDEDVRGLLRFGADLTAAQVFNAVISNVDRLIVGKIFGASPLGMYRQAQQLVMAPIEQLTTPIGSVSQPGLSMLQNDPGRYRRYYARVTQLIGLATMPMAAFAAVYAEELTQVILGDKWTGTAPFFRIFALASFIRPVLGTAGTVLITSGQSRKLLVLTFASQIALLLFIVAGIGWGPQGVAMAYVLTAAVLLLPNLWYSFAGSPVTLGAFFTAVWRPSLASAFMAAALLAYRGIVPSEASVMSVCSGLAIGCASYFASYLLLPGGRSDLRVLLGDLAASMPGLRRES